MARPIKETPVLKGKDAERFLDRMSRSEERKETVAERDKRMKVYNTVMSMLFRNS